MVGVSVSTARAGPAGPSACAHFVEGSPTPTTEFGQRRGPTRLRQCGRSALYPEVPWKPSLPSEDFFVCPTVAQRRLNYSVGGDIAEINFGAVPDLGIARSSLEPKSSSLRTAVTASLGLSNGMTAIAARILTGNGIQDRDRSGQSRITAWPRSGGMIEAICWGATTVRRGPLVVVRPWH